MDCIAILTELSKSKEPYAVLDKHFKNDDPNANSLLNIDEITEQFRSEGNTWIKKSWIEDGRPYDRMALSLDEAFKTVEQVSPNGIRGI